TRAARVRDSRHSASSFPAAFLRMRRKQNERQGLPWDSADDAEKIYIVAIKRLRTLIEPELDATEKKRLPINNVSDSDQVRDLIAISALASALWELHKLLDLEPSEFENIDSAILTIDEDVN